ncbi:MAG: TonB-dependent receptor [candidate division WOR-3 bacterium]
MRGRTIFIKFFSFKLIGVFLLFLLIIPTNLSGAVTGKIAGIVIDARTGEPLVGANVVILGTDRGAACDVDGYYYILRLDPGIYDVQARMIGYKTVTKVGVRVESGHTTPLNFELEPTVIPGEGVTVKAEREIIKLDLSGSSITVDKSEIEAVPLISGVTQYLNLQAGIEGWSIRGSGLENTKLMADGLLLVDNRINEPIMMPNLSEIKEVSLLKGGFNAEFSNVRAGVVNVVTREGSPKKYEGTFEYRYTLGHLKHNKPSIFDPENYYNKIYLWNKLDTGYVYTTDPNTGETLSCDTVIKYDSVCWKGPMNVWGDKKSPFYDTVKQKSCANPSWKGWIGEATGKPITPEAARDLWLWRHRIDIPRTDSLFSIYSHDSAYIPIWDITVEEDGDTTYELTGFRREPYKIPEDQPRRGKYGDKPDISLDAGFGGPVPLVGKYLGDLSFYASYRDFKEAFPLPDSREYYRETQTSLKLTSRVRDNMKVNLRGAYSVINSLSPWATGEQVGAPTKGFIGQVYLRGAMDMIMPTGEWGGIHHGGDKIRSNPVNLFSLTSLTPFDVISRMYGVSFQHVLTENTFYDIRLTYVRSNNDAEFWYDLPKRMNDTVLVWFGDKFDKNGDWITDRNHLALYTANNIPYGFPDPDFTIDRIVGVGSTVWGPAQNCGTYNKSWSQTFNGKLDFTSQVNKYNEIKFGFEANYDKIHEFYIIHEGYGWPERGEEEKSRGSYVVRYDAYPILGGAYIQDKIEFEGMFANIGVRIDVADANTEWPSRKDSASIYSNYYSGFLKKELFEQEDLLVDVPALWKISPRMGISFPFLENSKLFFNYGHFYSLAPNAQRFMISWGRGTEPLPYIGNPFLDMARTISYEVGFESNIANQILARVTGYYKDTDNETALASYTLSTEDPSISYTTFENLKYSDIRGFEVEFRKPAGRFFTGWVIYDYQVRSEGKIGREKNYAWAADQAKTGLYEPEQTEPVPQPVFRAQVSFKTPNDWGILLGGYNLSLLYSWRGGRYGTLNPFGIRELGIVYQLENNIRWENERNLDLSLNKVLSVGGTNLTLFMDVHNVFDWQELSSQGFSSDYDETQYLKSLHLEIYNYEPFASRGFVGPKEGEKPDRIGELRSDEKPYINNPDREFLMYLDPRFVQFGIRFSF